MRGMVSKYPDILEGTLLLGCSVRTSTMFFLPACLHTLSNIRIQSELALGDSIWFLKASIALAREEAHTFKITGPQGLSACQIKQTYDIVRTS